MSPRRHVAIGLIVTLTASVAFAANDPVGVWNMKVRVGNIGAGVRTVLLKIDKDASGKYKVQMTNLQMQFVDVDVSKVEGDAVYVETGAFTYTLKVVDNELRGTVESPAGTQDIVAARQSTVLLVGDKPAPFTKTWSGVIGHRTAGAPPEGEPNPVGWVTSRLTSTDDWALVSRRNVLLFTNARAHEVALAQFAGKPVNIIGTMRADRLEIDKIEPAPPSQRR